ncbi:3-dehydroquinate synthase [Flavobacterium sp. ASW18X]|uniref:3-dehydroquinate synthase n=1 Tax=Flavobacterium sp. ASW18X TaxID=2572595 RepID=UPI0010ADE8A1|nr:3-dehydroquinate synthase [Flavobacterium sp. ASW18X]TKD63427.1 3-dehydroquinate synthase [Flavobacterium sp. ASW18X]
MKELMPITQSFTVNYQYQLLFTNGLFSLDNTLLRAILRQYKPAGEVKCFFVLDDKVLEFHPNLINAIKTYCNQSGDAIKYTHTLVVPGGEASKKDDAAVQQVLKGINDYAICRHSFVIAIGGGAVIDMVGYAAAIAHRSVKLIRVPTTVLAQNDAAVGVKNSINAFGKKNFLGTFALPYAIINDFQFLETLEQRDWISGVAEAVKVALIKDADFFQFIKNKAQNLAAREMESMSYVIHRCAELHMQHIALGGDPFESGSSRPLDFGHWAAHKLEQMTHYQLRHGEAVAIGMALDLTYAYLVELIDLQTLETILKVLQQIGFNLKVPVQTEVELSVLLKGIEEFREHLGGELTITLISEIGKKHDVHTIDYLVMKDAIRVLNQKVA